jgi:hypothetical protein
MVWSVCNLNFIVVVNFVLSPFSHSRNNFFPVNTVSGYVLNSNGIWCVIINRENRVGKNAFLRVKHKISFFRCQPCRWRTLIFTSCNHFWIKNSFFGEIENFDSFQSHSARDALCCAKGQLKKIFEWGWVF